MNELRKSPVLAGLLSLLPGLGQVYVGYYLSGFINVLVIAATITLLSSESVEGVEPFFGLFISFFWMFNIIDAVRKANLYNLHQMGEHERPPMTDSPLIGGLIVLVLGVLLTLHFTLNIDLGFLSDVWPLALLACGIYLLWKYARMRRQLREGGRNGFRSGPPPGGSSPGSSS